MNKRIINANVFNSADCVDTTNVHQSQIQVPGAVEKQINWITKIPPIH